VLALPSAALSVMLICRPIAVPPRVQAQVPAALFEIAICNRCVALKLAVAAVTAALSVSPTNRPFAERLQAVEAPPVALSAALIGKRFVAR